VVGGQWPVASEKGDNNFLSPYFYYMAAGGVRPPSFGKLFFGLRTCFPNPKTEICKMRADVGHPFSFGCCASLRISLRREEVSFWCLNALVTSRVTAQAVTYRAVLFHRDTS
jgi:hypothetical protein